jgi:hypothetical protein
MATTKSIPKLAKKRKERHHASAANDEKPSKKAKHEEIDFFYYLALTESFEDNMWLINSGASRDMTSDRENLSSIRKRKRGTWRQEPLRSQGNWKSFYKNGIR